MKKINSLLFSIFMLLVCLLSIQNVFAVDVPLKKGDPGGIGGTSIMSRSISVIPVSVSLINPQLVIYFNNSIGIAHITIVDQNDSIVYQDVIDTYSSIESVIETSGWDSGNYKVKIVYGSTKLVGTFQL